MAFGICLRLGQTITLWEQTYHKLSTGIVSKNKLTYGRFWGGVLYVECLQLWDSGLSLFSTSITLFLRSFSSSTIKFLSWSKTSTLTSSLGSVFITIFNEKIRPSSMWRKQQSRRATATCVVISWPERGAAVSHVEMIPAQWAVLLQFESTYCTLLSVPTLICFGQFQCVMVCLCVKMCVYVCERETERKREKTF